MMLLVGPQSGRQFRVALGVLSRRFNARRHTLMVRCTRKLIAIGQ